MKARFQVIHAFATVLGKDVDVEGNPRTTWVTRDTVDDAVARMSVEQRDDFEARGYIRKVAGAPLVDESPASVSLPSLEPDETFATASAAHKAQRAAAKGGK